MLTEKEKAFLLNLLSQLSVKASDPGALETVGTVQGIVQKLAKKEGD